MKRKFYYFLLPLLAWCLALPSCKEDDDTIPPYAKFWLAAGIEVDDLVVNADSANIIINVESNASWKAEITNVDAMPAGNTSWIYANPSSGTNNGIIKFVVQPNTSVQTRTANAVFYLEGQQEKKIKITQSASKVVLVAGLVDTTAAAIPAAGANVEFKVACNTDWTYAVQPATGVSEVSKSATSLVLAFAENAQESELPITVTFIASGRGVVIDLVQAGTPKPQGLVADLLDVQFQGDGTAVDVSPSKRTVETVAGAGLVTYYNDALKRYVANFRHSLGTTEGTGFYRVPYTKGDAFINDIADGCTFESVFKLQTENPGTAEIKWFSSMQAGGIGLILPLKSRNNSITFLPNISTTGASNWCWTHSNIIPQVGKYYHVVGVYDKEKGETRIYVNGALCNTVKVPGNYVPVATGAEYFCIGGDANVSKTCEASLDGEVVSAKIYSKPLTDEEVAKAWEAAKFDENAEALVLSNLQFLPLSNVGPGYGFVIYGNGFKSGDKVELQSLGAGSAKYLLDATVTANNLTIDIPKGMASGSYRMMLVRNGAMAPIGTAEFNYSSNPRKPSMPKIIAHRGIHDTSARTENSCASLRAAMEFGAYGSELDVHLTTDGRVVVHHDGVMNGVTFQNATYDQIKDFKLANGENLPTFDQMIEIVKELKSKSPTKLIVEFKTGANGIKAVDAVLALVKAAGIEDRIEYISFGYDVCKYIMSKDPNAIVGYLNGNYAPATCYADKIMSIDYHLNTLYNNKNWITDAQKLGMIVNVWTVNSATDMLNFIGLGVDYITTDQCAMLKGLNDKNFIIAK